MNDASDRPEPTDRPEPPGAPRREASGTPDLATLAGRGVLPAELRDAPAMRKLDHVLGLADPAGFVGRLATQELYLLMHDIGVEDAYVLLEYAEPEQIQGLLDLDIWSKYEIQIDRVARWLELARAVDVDTALKTVRASEDDLLQYLFLKDFEIHPKDLDLDLVPDTVDTVPSPDGEFWVLVPKEHPLADRVPELLRLVFGADPERAHWLFTVARFELQAPMEERLLRFRDARLGDAGFVGAGEALKLYTRVAPGQVRADIRDALAQRAADAARAEGIEEGETKPPKARFRHRPDGAVAFDLALVGVQAPPLFSRAMGRLDDAERARVAEGLTAVINQAFMARTGDLSHVDALPHAGDHVASLVALGLAHLADESEDRAVDVLLVTSVKTLFQTGYALTFELALEARRLRKRAGSARGLRLFGAPLDEAFEGAALPHPRFYRGLDDEAHVDYRDYRTLADVATMRAHLDRAEQLIEDFEARFGFSPDALLGADLGDRYGLEERRTIRLGTLMRTALAHGLLDGDGPLVFRPLSREELGRFLGLAFSGAADVRQPSEALEALLEGLGERTERTVDAELDRWIRRQVDELALALGRVRLGDLDPKYAAELLLVDE